MCMDAYGTPKGMRIPWSLSIGVFKSPSMGSRGWSCSSKRSAIIPKHWVIIPTPESWVSVYVFQCICLIFICIINCPNVFKLLQYTKIYCNYLGRGFLKDIRWEISWSFISLIAIIRKWDVPLMELSPWFFIFLRIFHWSWTFNGAVKTLLLVYYEKKKLPLLLSRRYSLDWVWKPGLGKNKGYGIHWQRQLFLLVSFLPSWKPWLSYSKDERAEKPDPGKKLTWDHSSDWLYEEMGHCREKACLQAKRSFILRDSCQE